VEPLEKPLRAYKRRLKTTGCCCRCNRSRSGKSTATEVFIMAAEMVLPLDTTDSCSRRPASPGGVLAGVGKQWKWGRASARAREGR
ncbi:MAG: hypothetical protein SGPRY_006701, partial [Prymnesium sp.]